MNNMRFFYDEFCDPLQNVLNIGPLRGKLQLSVLEKKCHERIKLYNLVENGDIENKVFQEIALELIKRDYPEFYISFTQLGSTYKELRQRCLNRAVLLFLMMSAIFSKNNVIRNWVLTSELKLFRLRLNFIPVTILRNALLHNKLCLDAVEMEMRDAIKYLEIYKVPWQMVKQLVAQRLVELRKGYAYPSDTQVATVITTYYQNSLYQTIKQLNAGLPNIVLDERLKEHFDRNVRTIHRALRLKGKESYCEFPIDEDEVNLNSVNSLAESFPPCMVNTYSMLHEQHHLKYEARKQLILFLKNIGLSNEDMINLIKDHSEQIMSFEEYKRKKYEYFIRHLYGLEGSNIQYKCDNCASIISNKFEFGSSYGCPLTQVNSTEPYLLDCDTNETNEVLSQIKLGSPRRACALLLNIRVGEFQQISIENSMKEISNPIQYYAKHRYYNKQHDLAN